MIQISELFTIFWISAGKFCSNSVKTDQSRLLEQKQLRIDTDILHHVGLEFDVDYWKPNS